MAKVIVTGGCGFIGSHLVDALCKRGDDVFVIDNLHTGYRENIATSKAHFVSGDILDGKLLEETFIGATSVFHLAARISVPESMQQPIPYAQTNSLGTLNILEACCLTGVKNFILSSSAALYGNNPLNPKKETMQAEPASPYALTKLDGEFYCSLYRQEYGLNAVALRYFNVFGPRQDPGSPYAAAIPIFIDKALRDEDITIWGDGEQTRDFIFVKDIVQANLLAEKKGGDVFNVAYGERITINDLAKTIIEITKSKSNIVYQHERPGDIKHSQADITKISKQLGFKPQYNLTEGLTETIQHFYDTRKSTA